MPLEPPLPESLFVGPFGAERRRMVECQLWGRDIRERRVLEAMARVPREDFIPESAVDRAYEDAPQNIGHGQTISQPYMVAKMVELARVRAGDRVLEIGVGSGYQMAVLLELGARVYGVEIVPALADAAAERLRRLGYSDFQIHCRDGYDGLPEAAPFSAILLAAAPEWLPPALIGQLGPGGRLVAPVGPFEEQRLHVYTRLGDGAIERQSFFAVRFVPLTGRALEISAPPSPPTGND